MKLKINVSAILGLQVSQIFRFIIFLIISAVFTKKNITHLSTAEIGDFEMITLITSALSFFWVTGIIQSFLPLYNNNNVFPAKTHFREKSAEIYNTFLLLSFFSGGFALLIFLFRHNIYVYKDLRAIPYIVPLVFYFIFSNISPLVEYIYYVRNRPYQILNYIFWTSSVQLVLVLGPVILGWGLEMGIWGLVLTNVLKFIWLLILLEKYAKFKFSFNFIKAHMRLGIPLVLSTLLSGSSQYIDGFIASWTSLPGTFTIFRYGAKELPFASSFANGLNNAMLTKFDTIDKMNKALNDLKVKSLKLMHYLFPFSIVVMIFSKWIFGHLFNHDYYRSSDVFLVYLLMIISRMLFPQTILIGLKKTRVVFWASLLEIIINIGLSLILIHHYGIVGIALATAFIHILEKLFMIGYNFFVLGISPKDYIPLGWFLFYSSLLTLVFVLIDHKILFLY